MSEGDGLGQKPIKGRYRAIAACFGLLMIGTAPAKALDSLDFDVRGGGDDIGAAVRASSLLVAAERDGVEDAQDLFAAARAEYGRLLGTLYAQGYYSSVISVKLDGREAAAIAPLEAPTRIGKIVVRVEPGALFRFAQTEIGPLAPGTDLPGGFAPGAVAESDVISQAANAAIDGWRAVGHAKADLTRQDVTADHRRSTLSARLGVAPGPKLRFGALKVVGQERMELARILKIAGLPQGETFSPKELEDAANRLRRTGVFRSVALVEDEAVSDPDLLGITARVVEEKTRRYSLGLELASSEGATVSGYWLHRNLLGGAERLRVDGSVSQIGAQDSGVDYALGVTLERPATLSRDTTAALSFGIERLDEADYLSDAFNIGVLLTHFYSDNLTFRLGLTYDFSNVTDAAGDTNYRTLSVPLGALWDNRNSKTDASKGYYLDAEVAPFYGFGTTDSGARMTLDGRAYHGFGAENRVVLAGRLQVGAVLGADLDGTPRDYLFYSGGGGTVRGQPYQSLGATSPSTGVETGGTGFLGASVEVRTKITQSIGLVGFADFGQIATESLFSGSTQSHAGAGIGLRYDTGFGPIRLDLAAPVSGDTGSGMQVYVGIGQAF
jgi:translocation and assembly module TamA